MILVFVKVLHKSLEVQEGRKKISKKNYKKK